MVLHGLLSRRSIALLVVLVGCSDTDCASAGCTQGVEVQAPAAVAEPSDGSLTVCVGESCRTGEFADDGAGTTVEFEQAEPGEVATAVLEMPDGTSYSAEGILERFAPNGEDCPPVCAVAALTLTGS